MPPEGNNRYDELRRAAEQVSTAWDEAMEGDGPMDDVAVAIGNLREILGRQSS